MTSSEQQTSFYLHSSRHRRLYPRTQYPLTHLLDEQSIANRCGNQPTYVKHFKYTFILLLLFISTCTIFFKVHIYAYNSFFGPFHLSLDEFVQHVQQFESGQSWFKRIEYIQVELGENNIHNPLNTLDTIRRYSDHITRRHHVATYKKVKTPRIYVKLPTRSRKHFHVRLPFDFSSYSIRTLQCISRHLQRSSGLTYPTWLEKSEYVRYIDEEYTKNATQFNMLVVSKCGILLGYLYRPLYEKAFVPTNEYKFSQTDIAFDATRQYYPFYVLVIGSLVFLWLFLKATFYLTIYLSNIARFKLFHKYGLLSFPLVLSAEVVEELWLLNIDSAPHEQLLQLDELIRRSEHKFQQQLFIIENEAEQLFVVVLHRKLEEGSMLERNLSPFMICPVTDIRKIVQYGGICYGRDSSWIPWPSTMTEEYNYSEWLHEELMQTSEHYKQQYEHRLRWERDNEDRCLDNHSNSYMYPALRYKAAPHRERQGKRTVPETKLQKLIREEENVQRLKRERQLLYERIMDPVTAASPQFIAEFRMKQETNKNIVDERMENENVQCMVCLEYLKADESYEEWPCPSAIPHVFHYDCMLEILRRKNTCPICRHPVTAARTTDDGVLQFFTRLAL